ncbi:hypothetical protein [Acrocarpospora sp. B8E8]|uniref:hypothetical protein n=1 Tax=Acrocarpospora sp. B8E8 TaxID=3153572 RepID=UPI00325E62CD
MTIDNLPAVRHDSLPERQEYAKALSVSNLLPPEYRGNPGNVLYAVEFGRSIGIEPITAITEVHIIKGKPSSSAGLVSALVRAAGHRMRTWVERDANGRLTAAISTVHRKDDPDFEFRSEWTMARAQDAGLIKQNENYTKYPEGMLIARSQTEVARMACKEALCGLGYTPEELGAEVNADGSIVVTSARTVPNAQTIRGAVTPPEPQPEPPPTAERMISEPQQKKMGALMREAGITDRDTALAFVADVIGREVASRNELTLAEAGRVIDYLENPPATGEEPQQAPEVDDGIADADVVDPAELYGSED